MCSDFTNANRKRSRAPRLCCTQSVQTGRQADRPLYAVVSEELVGKEGSLVMALSTPQRRRKVGAPFNALQRVPADKASGSRGSDRFALLELPVEPPVDLVVGGRWAVPRPCCGKRGIFYVEVSKTEDLYTSTRKADLRKIVRTTRWAIPLARHMTDEQSHWLGMHLMSNPIAYAYD